MSVVIPAYNEEGRILSTLEEAVEYLDKTYGRRPSRKGEKKLPNLDGGYEIIVVNDCSKDRTVHVALEFARRHDLHDIVRVVNLERNRGKGGAITHAFRHVRGKYVLFADADGASKFSDLAKLMKSLEKVTDGSFRGVAIGSRAHMVGSDAVVKVGLLFNALTRLTEHIDANHCRPPPRQRSALRNFLMRGFHFGLSVLTPPATSRINDTQCGFKLFTRASLPHIVPYMHAEGWIFDIEMLMLAESSPPAPIFSDDGSVIGTTQGIRVAEVPIAWHEVGGSKMNLLQDSIKMAWGLAVLRASWMFGVYSRRMV
jgi:dolichyl-phosphate beta-glucosyltransferase